jgi:hypothetical protein
MTATGTSFTMKRRSLLLGATGFSGLTLFGCGGSDAPTPSAPALLSATADVWDLSPWMWFIEGQSRVIDLSLTLPPDVVRGGAFGLASGSAPLPPGFTLQPSGLLTVANPTIGQTANVQFTYAEPGT